MKFRAQGWIAYDVHSLACTSQISQLFTDLHTKNGRYCLFNTSDFYFGPFDPGATTSVDSSQAPDPELTFNGVADADVASVIDAAAHPAATFISVITEQTATSHSSSPLCEVVADRDTLMRNGGWQRYTLSAVSVDGVGCDALTSP